jgi:hypothetical protein
MDGPLADLLAYSIPHATGLLPTLIWGAPRRLVLLAAML